MATTDDKIIVQTIQIPRHLVNSDVINFAVTVNEMTDLYAKKNHDYGNSFEKGMDVIGLPYGVGRLYDKMNRIITIMNEEPEISAESIKDTVIDLACYSVMLYTYLYKKENYELDKSEC